MNLTLGWDEAPGITRIHRGTCPAYRGAGTAQLHMPGDACTPGEPTLRARKGKSVYARTTVPVQDCTGRQRGSYADFNNNGDTKENNIMIAPISILIKIITLLINA